MQQTRLESQTWTPSVQRWRLHVSSGHVETSALNRLNEVFRFELFEMKTCCWNTELLVFSVPWLEKVSVYVSWLHNSWVSDLLTLNARYVTLYVNILRVRSRWKNSSTIFHRNLQSLKLYAVVDPTIRQLKFIVQIFWAVILELRRFNWREICIIRTDALSWRLKPGSSGLFKEVKFLPREHMRGRSWES